jgi:hypothetical protein
MEDAATGEHPGGTMKNNEQKQALSPKGPAKNKPANPKVGCVEGLKKAIWKSDQMGTVLRDVTDTQETHVLLKDGKNGRQLVIATREFYGQGRFVNGWLTLDATDIDRLHVRKGSKYGVIAAYEFDGETFNLVRWLALNLPEIKPIMGALMDGYEIIRNLEREEAGQLERKDLRWNNKNNHGSQARTGSLKNGGD